MASFVEVHRERWPVAVMCRTIGLPERTFHAAKGDPVLYLNDPPGVDRELQLLWGTPHLQAAATRGLCDRPLHRDAGDGRDRSARRATRP